MSDKFALMVHPLHGRMNVPEVKIQEYLELGYSVLERFTSDPGGKVTVVSVEEPEAASEDEPKAKPKGKK